MEPSDVFTTREGGVWLDAGDNIDDFVAVGFTVEDDGGSDRPTTEPFAIIELGAAARAR